MKTKIPILFGMILLMALLSLIIVSADSCDWGVYGNAYTPLWNEQLSTSSCYGIFHTNFPSNYSMSQGMTVGTQPLVIGYNNISFLFFNNGNYLQVYDKNLVLQNQVLTGLALANLDSVDFNNDGMIELVNLYKYNNTIYTLKSYFYNPVSNMFSLDYQYNITGSQNLAGLRHSGSSIYFTNSSDLIKINRTDFISIPILSSSSVYTEPLSFYVDYNNDGIRDFMTYDVDKVIIFDENGNVILERAFPNTAGATGSRLRSARMINPYGNTLWKLVVLTQNGISFAIPTLTLTEINMDNSTNWAKTILTGSGSTTNLYGDIAIGDDYDGDNMPDIYVAGYKSYPLNQDTSTLNVYDGNDGSLLSSKLKTYSSAYGFISNKLTLADMNHDGKNDFVNNMGNFLEIYDMQNNNSIFNQTISIQGYCIPADLRFEGTQDIICSSSGNTIVFYSNYTNQNAQILSVIYDPSTTFSVGTTLSMIITATDLEGNMPFYYKHKCFSGDNWSVENTNPTQSCYYGSVGTYTNTIAVRDYYHSDFNSFSQTIYVTSSGVACGNGICESGETNANCPADCSSNTTQTQATEIGGMPLPTKIVDVNNVEQGLLPEIYYGTLAFLSGTLTPMIILVFFIFFVMIIFAIGFIIKKMAGKVGELSR